MIETKEVEVVQKEVVAKICDKCGLEVSVLGDTYEAQEFHHIRFQGGFGSVFGDGNNVECDLCQKCLMEFIEPHYRITF
jgi:hypothetical protein